MKQNEQTWKREKDLLWYGNLKGVAEMGPENDRYSWNIYAKLTKTGLNDKTYKQLLIHSKLDL